MGWKDILRPIRDHWRDNQPTKPDPVADEREEQRRKDVLKGFAYFDTFDQVESWNPEDVDLLQLSNTPLLLRTRRRNESPVAKSNVLLCHDYSGNYHDYEACQGIGVDIESYCCEYLQYVDAFIYFSHKLVCIPPPMFINTCHRNGVTILGTFIVEPQNSGIERILRREVTQGTPNEHWSYPLARQLAQMALCYGFDGWLINIEKTFPIGHWDPHMLQGFITQLKLELGRGGRVIWYDALTKNNNVAFQNSLTDKNIEFARSAGSILTNYQWNGDLARQAKTMAVSNQLSPEDVFFGIDVW
ncbi:hypothetical protein LTR16_002199, partial [Cryomyces antarcticus]